MRTCVSWKVGLDFNGSAASTFRIPAVSTQIIPENINKITSYNFPSNFKVSEVEKFDLWYYNWLPSSERTGFAQEIFFATTKSLSFLFYFWAVSMPIFLPFVFIFKLMPRIELSYRRHKKIFSRMKGFGFQNSLQVKDSYRKKIKPLLI
jgi:hypothetical protein